MTGKDPGNKSEDGQPLALNPEPRQCELYTLPTGLQPIDICHLIIQKLYLLLRNVSSELMLHNNNISDINVLTL